MQTRREFLSTTTTIAASSTLALMSTGCIEIEEMSLQDKFSNNIYTSDSLRSSASVAETPDNIVLHTLKRISFGIKQGDLEHASSIGLNAYIEEQLQPESIQDTLVTDYIARTYPRLQMSGSELFKPGGSKAHGELKKAAVYRMINSRRQLFEVMVDFWGDHFNIEGSTGRLTRYKSIDDREVIRKHALGNFRNLLHASAKSPAMLKYLNNDTNTKSGPNENYAREVMELHTLGIHGGYTEQDIQEAARCFTGWNIDRSTIHFKFESAQHDYDPKQLLGHLIPAGQGVEDGEQLLDILLDHPATAKYIATKLVRRFVADNPPASLVNRVADTYQINNGDIPSMLRVIFYSDEFKIPENIKFKRPNEYIASVYRALGVDLTTFIQSKARFVLGILGQTPFEWPSPDGYPDVALYWNNTQGLGTRWEFALTISEVVFNPKDVYLTGWLSSIRTAEDFVDQFSNRILHKRLDNRNRDQLILLITNNTLQPDDELSDSTISKTAATVTAALLSMPAFMLR